MSRGLVFKHHVYLLTHSEIHTPGSTCGDTVIAIILFTIEQWELGMIKEHRYDEAAPAKAAARGEWVWGWR